VEHLVNYRSDQHVKADDLSNTQLYAQGSFDHIVADGIDSGKKYTGLATAKTGPTEITVASGRFYTGGQVYVRDTQTVFSLISNLPAATQRIGTVVVWGLTQEESIEPRAYIINADTGQFEPREVTMETTRALQMSVVYGPESAQPTRGTIDSTVIAIADVLLSTAGVVSVTMDQTTALSSVAAAQLEIDDLSSWRSAVSKQIDTITSDIAIIKASIPPNLSASLTAFANAIADIYNILKKPASAFWTGVDRFINLSDTDTGHAGYSAKVEDGLTFPAGTSVQTGVSLLNPLDSKVITVNNMTLPAYIPYPRHTVLPLGSKRPMAFVDFVAWASGFTSDSWSTWLAPWQGSWLSAYQIYVANLVGLNYVFVGGYPVVTLNWKRRYLARTVVRYGARLTYVLSSPPDSSLTWVLSGQSYVVDQSSAAGLAEIARRPALPYYQCVRSGGEPYTFDWPTFWNLGNPSALIADRDNHCYVDYYNEPYWDAVYSTGSHSGSCFSQVFLNESNGWMTHLRLLPRDIGPSGDVQIHIVEVDNHLRPDHQRVMSHVTVSAASLRNDAFGTLIAITPCYLKGGTNYAVIVHTPGNHSFYCVAATEFVEYGLVDGHFWYFDTTGVWILAPVQQRLFMQVFMAKFISNRYEVQMQPASLSGGISDIRITSAVHAPDGTSFHWEVQNGGVWQPLAADSPTALATNPALVPVRAVFTGTSDVMPAIDLTQAELDVSMVSTGYTHWSQPRTLLSNTTSVKVLYDIEGWDAAHHSLDCRLEIGGVTSGTAGTITSVPDPQNPTTLQVTFAFTVSSTNTYAIKSIATKTSGSQAFNVKARWDSAF
jgi:hypothetical protein